MFQTKNKEKKFGCLFEAIADSIFIADPKSRKLIDCNKRAEKLTGYSRKKILSMRAETLHPKDLVKRTMDDFKKHAAGKILVVETEVLAKGRKRIPVSINSAIVEVDGKPCVLGIFRDMSERKKAEEKIKESEKKYRLLAENSIDCVWMLDTKLRFTYLSPSVEKLMGVKPKQWVGTKLSSHFRKKEFLKASALAVKAITHYKTVTHVIFETKMLNNKNEEVNIEVSNKALFNSQSKLIGLQGTARDITERKKAEEDLKESEEKFRLIYETSSDAIMTLEPPTWAFTSGNPAIVKMFGVRDEKEFTSVAPWQVSPEYQPDGQLSKVKAKKMIGIAMKKGENFFEWTHKKVRGKEFFATVLLNRVELRGKTFLQARVNDITEKKETEIKINEKVEELEKFYKMAIGRELRMIELKKEIEKLKEKLEKVK